MLALERKQVVVGRVHLEVPGTRLILSVRPIRRVQ